MTADPSAGAVPPEPDSASFDLLVEALGRWAAAAPAWPPGRRVQAAWADAAPRLEKARRDLARVLVVGVVGGTGTGKSTLVNALAGAEVSSAGDVARPTTVSPVVVAARDVDVSWLPLEALAARLVRSDAAAVASIVLIDCPDPDTQDLSGSGSPLPGRPSAANRNRDLLETVLPACDVLLLVSSAQKYRSWVVARELAAFAPGRPLLFVQTHASRDPDIRADWRRELEAQGFEVPRIFRVDGVEACARAAAGREQDAGFRELVAAIEAEFSGRQARRVRRTGALDLAAWFTRQAHGDLAASGAPLATLVAGCDAERRRLEAILGRAIGETLRGNRAAWQRLICDDVVARWHGGPFASFLHVIAALAGFWQRVRPATGLVGRLLAGQPLPSAAAGGWRALEELGLPAGEVEQSRSVLVGLATRAGMQEPLVGRARLDEAGTASATAAVVDRAGQWLATGIDRLVAERRRRIGRGAVHLVFEGAFLALLVTVLVRAGWNFFHGNLWEGRPVSGIGFLEESLVWVILWGLVLRWLVFALVRLGLDRDIQSLVGSLGSARLVDPLLHDFDAAGRAATARLDEGARLAAEADRLARAGGETPGLGRLRGQPASPPVRDA